MLMFKPGKPTLPTTTQSQFKPLPPRCNFNRMLDIVWVPPSRGGIPSNLVKAVMKINAVCWLGCTAEGLAQNGPGAHVQAGVGLSALTDWITTPDHRGLPCDAETPPAQ